MYRRAFTFILKINNIGKVGWGRTVHEAQTRAALEMIAYLNQHYKDTLTYGSLKD